MIIWAGTSNLDVGMVVEHYPKPIIPRRKIEVQSVPGRNGDIILEQDAFENYEQPYSVFLDAKHIGGLSQVMPKLSDWLLGNKGYQKLEDSYFPDVYRMAYYSGGSEFISIFNEYGEGTLTFNCAPEKYLKSGDYFIPIASGTVIRNPTAFAAFPIIRVVLKGKTSTSSTLVGTISFNGTVVITITVPASSTSSSGWTINIDTKNYACTGASTGVNRSGWLTGSYENMKLEKETAITFNSNITSILLKPRWWTI